MILPDYSSLVFTRCSQKNEIACKFQEGGRAKSSSPRGANATSATTALTGVLHTFRVGSHLEQQNTKRTTSKLHNLVEFVEVQICV